MKKLLLAAFVAVITISSAYAAVISPQGPFRAFDANGDPCNGCKLYTYTAGTTSNKDSYTDNTEGTSNANPVILDSDGYANVWLGGGAYKLVLKTSADATIWTIDNVTGSAATGFGSTVTSITTTTTITTAHKNNLLLTTSSPTLNLLSAATAGDGFVFIVRNNDAGTTTIDPNGSETIDGSATMTLSNDEWVTVLSDGTNWEITGNQLPASATMTGTLTAGTLASTGNITAVGTIDGNNIISSVITDSTYTMTADNCGDILYFNSTDINQTLIIPAEATTALDMGCTMAWGKIDDAILNVSAGGGLAFTDGDVNYSSIGGRTGSMIRFDADIILLQGGASE